jgi:hypothetical protein
MASSTEWDIESLASSTSSSPSSCDEDEVNARVLPDWGKYRCHIERRGYRLDTVRDVKDYYRHHCNNIDKEGLHVYLSGYHRALARSDEDDLFKDIGLVSPTNCRVPCAMLLIKPARRPVQGNPFSRWDEGDDQGSPSG